MVGACCIQYAVYTTENKASTEFKYLKNNSTIYSNVHMNQFHTIDSPYEDLHKMKLTMMRWPGQSFWWSYEE